ncbi:MAG: YciI family protein [Actinobacteria bacterium]|nr:YciI family protein [Actinomycetota bacterium]
MFAISQVARKVGLATSPIRFYKEAGLLPEPGAPSPVIGSNGPFTESKEHIGGFYIINADDLDAALAWAGKVVDVTNHPIEVRPFRVTGRPSMTSTGVPTGKRLLSRRVP